MPFRRRNPFVAGEGILPLLVVAAAGVLGFRYFSPWAAVLALVLFILLFLLFRDPRRQAPSSALGIVSPVDGKVVEVEKSDRCVVQGEAYRVRIRVNSFGTYTARSPVEGKVMNLKSREQGVGPDCPGNAFWVQTDEGDNVVLQFQGYRFGLVPKSFVRYGERIGQGHRCAYLRLTRYAEVYLPIAGQVVVKPGQPVLAGSDLIGSVPHS
ncbi:MAG: phosphatidylserine decarboxylase [Woeseiaceae bacterium]|nr:phosphatidylserine decarboxylase [Woeseiaceae bacterium]